MGLDMTMTDALLGTWEIVSYRNVDTETGEGKASYGAHPRGFMIFLPTGRMMVFQTAEGRPAAVRMDDDASAAAAFRTMMGYSGRYRVEGDKFTTTLDVAWHEDWVGTDQVRRFKIIGDELHIKSAPVRSPDGRMRHGELVWRRSGA
jgi:hypothetical protein